MKFYEVLKLGIQYNILHVFLSFDPDCYRERNLFVSSDVSCIDMTARFLKKEN